MDTCRTYVVRLWLPDRPGALGLVASRFGALKGDVVGLEIIERGSGVAIDELVVSLPADVSIDLMVKVISADEGVEVEDVRLLDGTTYDPQLDVLEAATIVLGAETRLGLAMALTEHARRVVRSSWACVVERDGGIVASLGDRPNARWLESFIAGSAGGGEGPDGSKPDMEAVCAPLPIASLALVVGGETVIRAKERQRLVALARIADAWLGRMDGRSAEPIDLVEQAGAPLPS